MKGYYEHTRRKQIIEFIATIENCRTASRENQVANKKQSFGLRAISAEQTDDFFKNVESNDREKHG